MKRSTKLGLGVLFSFFLLFAFLGPRGADVNTVPAACTAARAWSGTCVLLRDGVRVRIMDSQFVGDCTATGGGTATTVCEWRNESFQPPPVQAYNVLNPPGDCPSCTAADGASPTPDQGHIADPTDNSYSFNELVKHACQNNNGALELRVPEGDYRFRQAYGFRVNLSDCPNGGNIYGDGPALSRLLYGYDLNGGSWVHSVCPRHQVSSGGNLVCIPVTELITSITSANPAVLTTSNTDSWVWPGDTLAFRNVDIDADGESTGDFSVLNGQRWTVNPVTVGAPLVITDITDGNPRVVTFSAAHGFSGAEMMTFAGTGLWDLDGRTLRVGLQGANAVGVMLLDGTNKGTATTGTAQQISRTTFEITDLDSTGFVGGTDGRYSLVNPGTFQLTTTKLQIWDDAPNTGVCEGDLSQWCTGGDALPPYNICSGGTGTCLQENPGDHCWGSDESHGFVFALMGGEAIWRIKDNIIRDVCDEAIDGSGTVWATGNLITGSGSPNVSSTAMQIHHSDGAKFTDNILSGGYGGTLCGAEVFDEHSAIVGFECSDNIGFSGADDGVARMQHALHIAGRLNGAYSSVTMNNNYLDFALDPTGGPTQNVINLQSSFYDETVNIPATFDLRASGNFFRGSILGSGDYGNFILRDNTFEGSPEIPMPFASTGGLKALYANNIITGYAQECFLLVGRVVSEDIDGTGPLLKTSTQDLQIIGNTLRCLLGDSSAHRAIYQASGSSGGAVHLGTMTGGTTTTVVAFNAISDGDFTIDIDGTGDQDITGLDFTFAPDEDGVAAIIEPALRAIGTGGYINASVQWTGTAYLINSGNQTDLPSSVSALSDTGLGGTDISGSGLLDARTGTAVLGGNYYEPGRLIISGNDYESPDSLAAAHGNRRQFLLYNLPFEGLQVTNNRIWSDVTDCSAVGNGPAVHLIGPTAPVVSGNNILRPGTGVLLAGVSGYPMIGAQVNDNIINACGVTATSGVFLYGNENARVTGNEICDADLFGFNAAIAEQEIDVGDTGENIVTNNVSMGPGCRGTGVEFRVGPGSTHVACNNRYAGNGSICEHNTLGR